jgi:hypothetical protein
MCSSADEERRNPRVPLLVQWESPRLCRGLEFRHSGRLDLGERASVLSGGSRLDHALAGSGGVAGGKGHRVVDQLLTQHWSLDIYC